MNERGRAAPAIDVLSPGPLATIQDLGRPGFGSLGVGRSGACDRRSFVLANLLVGNPPGAAALEVTLGGLAIRAVGDLLIAATGARCPGVPQDRVAFHLRDGHLLRLRTPASGLRTYLAVQGGIAVAPVFGSRSTDLLSGIGPPVVAAGERLPVGPPPEASTPRRPAGPGDGLPPGRQRTAGPVTLRVLAGPRADWFTPRAWRLLTGREFRVGMQSNRIALRLDGDPLERAKVGELRSEGMTRGAIEVPLSGHPMVFLADHPVTGGYPVIAYVLDDDVDACGQLRPGQPVRFRPVDDEWRQSWMSAARAAQ